MTVTMQYTTPDGIDQVEREDYHVDGGLVICHDLKQYNRDTVMVPRERVIKLEREVPDGNKRGL